MAEIQHNQLTGADLHEPKGVETATAGQIYIADGAGSGDWTDPTNTSAWQLIEELNPSSVTASTSSDLSAWRTLRLTVNNLAPATAADVVLSHSANGTDFTIYNAYTRYFLSNSTETVANVANLTGNVNVATGAAGYNGVITLYNFNMSVAPTGTALSQWPNSVFYFGWSGLYSTGTTPRSHIRFTMEGQSFSGRIVIEGLL